MSSLALSIVGAVLTFLGGTAVAGANFYIQLRTLNRDPAALTHTYSLRQILNVVYLAGVFLLGRAMSWELFPLLLGAALGLTIPAFFFAARLVKLNDALHAKTAAEQKKGDEDDGGAL